MDSRRFRFRVPSIMALGANCIVACYLSVGTLPPVDGQSTRVPSIYDTQRKVETYVDSGRYDRDVAKVVAAARAWLDEGGNLRGL